VELLALFTYSPLTFIYIYIYIYIYTYVWIQLHTYGARSHSNHKFNGVLGDALHLPAEWGKPLSAQISDLSILCYMTSCRMPVTGGQSHDKCEA